jgi:hypothetical protein
METIQTHRQPSNSSQISPSKNPNIHTDIHTHINMHRERENERVRGVGVTVDVVEGAEGAEHLDEGEAVLEARFFDERGAEHRDNRSDLLH